MSFLFNYAIPINELEEEHDQTYLVTLDWFDSLPSKEDMMCTCIQHVSTACNDVNCYKRHMRGLSGQPFSTFLATDRYSRESNFKIVHSGIPLSVSLAITSLSSVGRCLGEQPGVRA